MQALSPEHATAIPALDADVVAWFKDSGESYQTCIKRAMAQYVARHGKRA